jgi:hypothetical protein
VGRRARRLLADLEALPGEWGVCGIRRLPALRAELVDLDRTGLGNFSAQHDPASEQRQRVGIERSAHVDTISTVDCE